MQVYDFYITPEEYKIAAENGICRTTLNSRIRDLAWDKEKAITTPPRMYKRVPKYLVEEAQQNGIPYIVLNQRLNILEWDAKKAVTEPIWGKEQRRKKANKMRDKNRKYPKEILELAEKNNISKHVFYDRINRQGLDILTAATRPIMTRKQISRLGIEAYRNLYGRKFGCY